MPEPDVLAGYAAAVTAVRRRLLELATSAWDSLGGYRDRDIDRLVALLVPRVQAGQLRIANLTAAYIAATTGTSAALVDAEAMLSARGVPAEEVYRRPAHEVYTALGEGKPFEAALALGRNRLTSLVATDMQMAKVRQADAGLRRSGATFYRRVLNGPDNCAKCIIASTRRYRVGTLLPIHPGCDCGVAQIRETDPPLVLDDDLLTQTHEQVQAFADIGDASAEGYQDLIVTHEHGEIGPVLSWRHQNFRGPADI